MHGFSQVIYLFKLVSGIFNRVLGFKNFGDLFYDSSLNCIARIDDFVIVGLCALEVVID